MVYNKKNDKKGNKHVDKANIYFFLKKKKPVNMKKHRLGIVISVLMKFFFSFLKK